MVTRTIEQRKIYSLSLNPIHANYEATNTIAFAYSKEELEEWYESLKCETYEENGYYRNFKKGSVLENYNLLESNDNACVREEWYELRDVQFYIDRCNNSFGFMIVPELVGCSDLLIGMGEA